MRRFISLTAAAGAVAAISAFVVVGGAAGASSSLPTLKIALTGTKGISLSTSDLPEGAVNVVATYSGKGAGSFALLHLNQGVSPQQAFQAVQSHHGDLNALTPYGTLFVSANAPGRIQTVLPTNTGTYLALNTTGRAAPAAASFNVHPSSSPATLPAASATQRAIDFAFRGPGKLQDGTIVRARNEGYLVHMITLVGARNKTAGKKLIKGLRAGKSRKALRPYLNGKFVGLLNPASPGALQQMVLRTKPGWYAEACFMDTQDGREHVVLGMERLVHVVK